MTELLKIDNYMKYISKFFFKRSDRIKELERYAQLGKMSHELFHDILNPITGLILYLDLIKSNNENKILKSSNLESGVKKEFEEISRSGERIKSFIKLTQENLLDKNRVENLNINKELKEIISLNYHKAKRNLVSIYIIQNGNIKIRMSKIKFYQLATNLISNSIDSFDKNTGNQKRKLVIKCEENKKEIFFNFIDNGCGIQKNKLNKIFKKNYSDKDYGLGIGLKTVKKIVSEYKGEIKLKSEINKGTTFKIKFPKNR